MFVVKIFMIYCDVLVIDHIISCPLQLQCDVHETLDSLRAQCTGLTSAWIKAYTLGICQHHNKYLGTAAGWITVLLLTLTIQVFPLMLYIVFERWLLHLGECKRFNEVRIRRTTQSLSVAWKINTDVFLSHSQTQSTWFFFSLAANSLLQVLFQS